MSKALRNKKQSISDSNKLPLSKDEDEDEKSHFAREREEDARLPPREIDEEAQLHFVRIRDEEAKLRLAKEQNEETKLNFSKEGEKESKSRLIRNDESHKDKDEEPTHFVKLHMDHKTMNKDKDDEPISHLIEDHENNFKSYFTRDNDDDIKSSLSKDHKSDSNSSISKYDNDDTKSLPSKDHESDSKSLLSKDHENGSSKSLSSKSKDVDTKTNTLKSSDYETRTHSTYESSKDREEDMKLHHINNENLKINHMKTNDVDTKMHFHDSDADKDSNEAHFTKDFNENVKSHSFKNIEDDFKSNLDKKNEEDINSHFSKPGDEENITLKGIKDLIKGGNLVGESNSILKPAADDKIIININAETKESADKNSRIKSYSDKTSSNENSFEMASDKIFVIKPNFTEYDKIHKMLSKSSSKVEAKDVKKKVDVDNSKDVNNEEISFQSATKPDGDSNGKPIDSNTKSDEKISKVTAKLIDENKESIQNVNTQRDDNPPAKEESRITLDTMKKPTIVVTSKPVTLLEKLTGNDINLANLSADSSNLFSDEGTSVIDDLLGDTKGSKYGTKMKQRQKKYSYPLGYALSSGHRPPCICPDKRK